MLNIQAGQIIRVRSRQYLVEEVTPSTSENGDTRVRLACLEDDAQGQQLQVFWEREVDAQVIGVSSWESVAKKGFDKPSYFSAYMHALRWNCVTSTNPKLFQAPYRAGIQVKAYQLEPLRKALLMPRISLFIADDVGLGKTIEAGLILREMLMRQKIQRVVISCPPSVVRQWQSEMENRFGLIFKILDRDFIAAQRRERGYSINPWTTHNRFIISHALIRDEFYAASLRDWLSDFSPGSMLILDEAHNAAPASSSKYAIDSQLTKTVRDIAPRFEHKLFLSATPHNGHSNSFAALLEILDPQRFCRGVPVKSKKVLDAVMVRRLKQDLREIGDTDFPERQIIPIIVDNLPANSPELRLAELLQEYRSLREERLKNAPKSHIVTAMLVITSLQKRLLSSIEAFARTLKVHRNAIQRQAENNQPNYTPNSTSKNFPLLLQTPGSDDDRAEIPEEEVQAEEDFQMTKATQAAALDISQQELQLLEEMTEIAESARYKPDGKIEKLIAWIKENLCPELGQKNATWTNRRVLIFTEYTDTKRYLERQLSAAIAKSDKENERIDSFHGGMGEDRRELIKTAFNTEPSEHPLRILIATDAAREGINLQNYCADLFHFDVPWNPSKMEQRNGRIDRKLQRENLVRCHYFVLPQRSEDRVLDVLVQKTATIHQELGSLSPVIEKNIFKLLDKGIHANQEKALTEAIKIADNVNDELVTKGAAIKEELESVRVQKEKLYQQQVELEDMLRDSRQWLGLSEKHFRDALSASLEVLGAQPLEPLNHKEAVEDPDSARWVLPALDKQAGADLTWATTIDTLRPERNKGQKLWEWRKETTIRPVVFRDPGSLDGKVVHLHLEHRIVQRLLGRFLSQGFLYDELTRACICFTNDPVPKVIALGRLSLYGDRAARLHDEVIAVAAEWIAPEARGKGKLRPLSEGEKKDALQVLEDSLANPALTKVPESVKERFKNYATQDVEELIPHLEKRAQVMTERANKKLVERGEKEASEMKNLLEEQRTRILKEIQKYQKGSSKDNPKNIQLDLPFMKDFNIDEKRQLEADIRHWNNRVSELEKEIISEPVRIQNAYKVKADRVEPVGLVYLWPISN
jgi:Helicase conserved C-terminal domain/SNF2-related domain